MTQSYQIPNPGQNHQEFMKRSAEDPFEVIAEPCSNVPSDLVSFTQVLFSGAYCSDIQLETDGFIQNAKMVFCYESGAF